MYLQNEKHYHMRHSVKNFSRGFRISRDLLYGKSKIWNS